MIDEKYKEKFEHVNEVADRYQNNYIEQKLIQMTNKFELHP